MPYFEALIKVAVNGGVPVQLQIVKVGIHSTRSSPR
jgi:hypothetical protein